MGISAASYGSPAKPIGVTKRLSPPRDSPKPKRNLRSIGRYFWYTAADGVSRLANSNNNVPEQINDYVFDPSSFAQELYPNTFPSGAVWPPQQLEDLVYAIGSVYTECVGDTCYNGNFCEDLACEHTLGAWKTVTQDWEKHFELCMTEGRGIGVITKRAFRQGAILGWYAGEIKPVGSAGGDYLMELEIGDVPAEFSPIEPHQSIYIDAEHRGNWTRFINHSCDPDAVFRIMRVGSTRIMAVEAIRDIPRNKELSVSYGEEYYGMETKKRCACGVAECIEKKRVRKERAEERKRAAEERRNAAWVEKRKVKRCKRARPPVLI